MARALSFERDAIAYTQALGPLGARDARIDGEAVEMIEALARRQVREFRATPSRDDLRKSGERRSGDRVATRNDTTLARIDSRNFDFSNRENDRFIRDVEEAVFPKWGHARDLDIRTEARSHRVRIDLFEPRCSRFERRARNEGWPRGLGVVGKAAGVVTNDGHGFVEVTRQPRFEFARRCAEVERRGLRTRRTLEARRRQRRVESNADRVDASIAFTVDEIAIAIDERERPVVT